MQWLKFSRSTPTNNLPPQEENNESPQDVTPTETDSVHYKRLRAVLESPTIDEEKLREALWRGVPLGQGAKLRPLCWKLTLGLLPLGRQNHECAQKRRIAAWQGQKQMYFNSDGELRADGDMPTWRQIDLDIRRTNASPAIRGTRAKNLMRRVLLVWAARHPASGYVQGLNDLLSIFVLVFLQEHTGRVGPDTVTVDDVDNLTEDQILAVEADSNGAFGELLALVQDCFVHEQPGIQQMLDKVQQIVSRLEPDLMQHLLDAEPNVLKICCFRWMNCFLVRELPLCSVVRLWDSYFAEGRAGFPALHVYACSALLMRWKEDLLSKDFNGIAEMLLHNPPTSSWNEEDVSQLLSEAHMLKCYFHDAPKHLV